MNLSEFNKRLQGLSSRATSNVKSALYEQAKEIKQDLQARSPVDTGIFRSSWVMSRMQGTGGALSMMIKNPIPYGHWLDEGGFMQGPPWYFPSTVGAKPTGKLTVQKGKVWAGGLSPSGFVVGGIVRVVLSVNRRKRFANAIADGIIGAV